MKRTAVAVILAGYAVAAILWAGNASGTFATPDWLAISARWIAIGGLVGYGFARRSLNPRCSK